jgi:transcriptional regulator NrdR family protein
MSLLNKQTAMQNPEIINATTAKMVIKSNGKSQEFSVEKLKKRVGHLLEGLSTEYMAIDQCIDKVSKYA